MESNMISLNEVATQSGFGRLVGISQPAVNEKVSDGLLPVNGTYQQWLNIYCERLREEAAGRSGEDQVCLTRERARLTKGQADKVERENAIENELKRDVSVLTEVLAQMSTKIAGKLEAIPVRIKREAGDVPREALEIIEQVIVDVRNIAYSIELDWESFDEMEEAARVGEEGTGIPESAGTVAHVSVGG